MKLLLDENLPEEFRHLLSGHEVFTARYMGWKGVKNGDLLRRTQADAFDALLTGDTGIEGEHNLGALPVAIVILHAKSNSMKRMAPLDPTVLEAPATLKPRTLVHVG